jgi:hypothetical protein
MKVLEKPIQMIAWFNEGGMPTPIKFKINTDEDKYAVIKVDRILFKDKEKIAGNLMYLFRCQSLINNSEKTYELKYELTSCKWMLYKM